MFLTRLIVNPQHSVVRRDLSDCAALHRTLMAGLPGDAPPAEARKHFGMLHRVETTRSGEVVILVQSRIEPTWTHLPEGYLAAIDAFDDRRNPSATKLGKLLETLEFGMRLRFRLRANATRKIDTKTGPDGKKRNGRRVPVRGDDALIAWLRRRAEKGENGESGGFTLVEVNVGASSTVAEVLPIQDGVTTGRRRAFDGAAAQSLTFEGTLFEGRLQVSNREALVETIRQGIGPGKAYGYGLLSVAPDRG